MSFNPKLTALKLCLKRMFESNHFSIVAIDSCIQLSGVIPNSDVYKIMHSVHCVPFKDMDDDFRQWIFEQTINMFNQPGFDIDRINLLSANFHKIYISS